MALSVLVAASCGDAPTVVVGGESATFTVAPEPTTDAQPDEVDRSAGEADDAFDRCDRDAGRPTAPGDWYRDQPRYVGNEQPSNEVLAWAESRPGFQELWIDRDRNGWVTVGFSHDVDARQAEIRERFPDDGVVAVLQDIDLAALRQLQSDISEALRTADVSSTIGVGGQGKVEVGFGVLSVENLAPLQPFIGQPICVEGRDPAGARTGPQVTTGEGWRLLAIDGSARNRGSEPDPGKPPPTPGGMRLGHRLEIATNAEQLSSMWEVMQQSVDGGFAAEAPVPVVDFDTEIVAAANSTESGSCPLQIFDVVVNLDARTVTVATGVSDDHAICTSDANTVAWAIAIERELLPPPPFTLSSSADLWVEADLRQSAASVVDDATIARKSDQSSATPVPLPPGYTYDSRPSAPPRPDAEPPPATPPPGFPHVIEPGFPSDFALGVGCVSAIGPLNGYVWAPVDASLAVGDTPDDWRAMEVDGLLSVELSLTNAEAGEATLDVTANGRTERYLIADIEPAC